jgi:hypothetical protein
MRLEPKGTGTIEYLPELLRITLLGTPVNKGRKNGRSCYYAPIPTRNATSLVTSAQVQRREIDLGFVRLPAAVQGTTAVSTKPP